MSFPSLDLKQFQKRRPVFFVFFLCLKINRVSSCNNVLQISLQVERILDIQCGRLAQELTALFCKGIRYFRFVSVQVKRYRVGSLFNTKVQTGSAMPERAREFAVTYAPRIPAITYPSRQIQLICGWESLHLFASVNSSFL